MTRKDLMAVLGVAAVTMAATMATLGPALVGADDKPDAIQLTIAQPELRAAGCVFTLATDKPAYQPGESPSLELKASNPTDKPNEAAVWVTVFASAPVSPLARMMPVATVLWSHEWRVSLKPGETRTLKLVTELKLPPRQVISITLGDKQQLVTARELSVLAAPAPDTTQTPRAPGAEAK